MLDVYKRQIEKWADRLENMEEIQAYQAAAARKSDFERTEVAKEKTGVRLQGVTAINPVNQTEIPIFISDYVLVSYGTGAIMAVPAHDTRDWEFAKKFDLPIIEAVSYTHLGPADSGTTGRKPVQANSTGRRAAFQTLWK